MSTLLLPRTSALLSSTVGVTSHILSKGHAGTPRPSRGLVGASSSLSGKFFGQRLSCKPLVPARDQSSGSSGRSSRRNLRMTTSASGEIPSEAALLEETDTIDRLQAHQKAAAKLTPAEEARTLLERCTRGVLSTISKKHEGFPFGSLVNMATDSKGRPILSISSLSPHTRDLSADPRCSLMVGRDLSNPSDTVVTFVASAEQVSPEEVPVIREAFLKRHPTAFYVDFGDFRFMRLEPKAIRYTTNVQTFQGGAFVTELSAEEYMAAGVDPIAPFESFIAGHMNADHADSNLAMAQQSLGIKLTSASILAVDRFGMRMEVGHEKLGPFRVRIPFPRPAADRKDVKDILVEMTKAAKASTAGASSSPTSS